MTSPFAGVYNELHSDWVVARYGVATARVVEELDILGGVNHIVCAIVDAPP